MKTNRATSTLVTLLVLITSCQATHKVFTIPSSSMEPTIRQGEKVAADMQPFQPKHGDLVIFAHDGIFLIKRVIGLSGDVVEGRNSKVFVNGKLREEKYVQHTAQAPLGRRTLEAFGPITVPEGKLFVAGDNRDYSLDSRDPEFGLVGTSEIEGKAIQIVKSSIPDREGKNLE